MSKSSVSGNRSKSNKPKKPYEGFPLTPHPTGRWCKKIRGKLNYFGPWNDPQAALERFNREWPYLSEGRTPPPVDTEDGLTVAILCNHFLTAKKHLLDSAEMKLQSWKDYYRICKKLVDAFGKDRLVTDLAADDFDQLRATFAKDRGPVSLEKDVRLTRIVCKYAFDAGFIDRPVRFGPNFKSPGKRILRQARQASGKRMFEAEDIQAMLGAARQPMLAMILLGINGGLGQTDIANLPRSAVDLSTGWLDYPRPKTAVERRIPLWSETVEALRDAIKTRPKPNDPAEDALCFVTVKGNRYVRDSRSEKQSWIDSVGTEFKKLLKRLGINGKRNFYALRHTFETVAGESKDQVAVNAIMGHVDNTMAGLYREHISDERLTAVTETVRKWLWPEDAD